MNWTQYCQFFNIPPLYHEVNLKKCKLSPNLRRLGLKWVSTPMQEKANLLLTGIAGSGKTFFAYSLLRECIEITQSMSCNESLFRFIKSNDLDSLLLNALLNKREGIEIKKFCEVPILFIDDLGSERSSERIISQYYTIIDYRISYKLPTIYTSNLSLADFNNPEKTNLGERIASRLSLCAELEFPAEDLRKTIGAKL